jgi:hypothetical protein
MVIDDCCFRKCAHLWWQDILTGGRKLFREDDEIVVGGREGKLSLWVEKQLLLEGSLQIVY